MKNFAEMMKQAQALQGRMADMQAELERTMIDGRSGGGMVTVTLSGKGDMAGVKIDPSLLKPEEADILRAFPQGLSPKSFQNRFFSPHPPRGDRPRGSSSGSR